MAGFGESLFTTGPIAGEVVYVGRGCDPAYQAGQPLDPYLADPAGQIVLIDRGSCTFVAKVKKAQDLGALMVIVANNAPGPAIAMGGADPTIVIPSVMVTLEDGNLFRANVPFNATVSDGTGGAPDRDSDLDAGVIAHEYGHGLSNRLTGGPATVYCLHNQEQMGEGWSDFLAVTFTSHPDDRPFTGRGVGSYVSFQPPDGPGIRPRPYTSDVSVNEYDYELMPAGLLSGELTVPHGVGFVWNTMLWDMYWNLVAKHGYNPNVYDAWNTGGNNLAIQLVVDGMKFQPCSPGFVDGRDAILAADQALTGGDNQCAIWRAFTKRGLGAGASQGSSNNVLDGVAAFDLPPSCGPQFTGFQPPVNGPPALTSTNAGSTVPVRFRLLENRGLGENGVAAFTQEIDCATQAPVGEITPGSRPAVPQPRAVPVPVPDRPGLGGHLPPAHPANPGRDRPCGVVPIPLTRRSSAEAEPTQGLLLGHERHLTLHAGDEVRSGEDPEAVVADGVEHQPADLVGFRSRADGADGVSWVVWRNRWPAVGSARCWR